MYYIKSLKMILWRIGNLEVKIIIGNNVGYRICRDKKTIEQLKNITIVINQEISVINDKENLPF